MEKEAPASLHISSHLGCYHRGGVAIGSVVKYLVSKIM